MNERMVLIIGGPEELRDGIKALVEAIPEVDSVISQYNVKSWDYITDQLKPDLVIIDVSKSTKDHLNILNQFKTLIPYTIILVVVEEHDQCKVFREKGADAAITKGFRGEQLVRTVRNLLGVSP